MKKRLLLLSFLFASSFIYSQDVGYNDINGNNIKTGMHANGSMFFNEDLNDRNFIVPYVPGQVERSTIYASGIWMSGLDPSGFLVTAYVEYANSFSEQYSAGPLNASDLNVDFNRVWKVTKSEIIAHILDFQDGTIDDPLSDNIEQWPARGNSFYNPLIPNQNLAPFFDANLNGIYDPNFGDYPIIGNDLINVIPEEMLFTIINTNDPSFDFPPTVEVHALMYALNCEENPVLENTLFTRHKFYNMGDVPYQNFKFSYWQDADLGCHTDDYIGCDTTLNSFFTYNEDEIDGNDLGNCSDSVNTYSENPPVQSTVFLNQKMESFIVIHNASFGSAPEATTDPVIANQYYNYMNGQFLDGTPMTKGGYGYNPESTDYTDYAFHDDPNDTQGWSMRSSSIPSGDPRALSTAGLDIFQPGQIFTLDLAHIFTSVPSSDNIESVTDAKVDMQSVQALYDSKYDGTCAISTSTNQLQLDHIKVYPNPSNGTFYIAQNREFDSYILTDNLGRVITTGAINSDLTQVNINAAKGTYILKLENTKTGKQLQKVVVVQ